MKVDLGYQCKTCEKCYHSSKHFLPKYCKKCGEDLVIDRFRYNIRIGYDGMPVETRETNEWGGYNYIHTDLSDHVEEVKLRRKFLFWWVLWTPRVKEVKDEY